MKIRYYTGEPVLPGDRVLLDGETEAILDRFVFEAVPLWHLRKLKFLGLLFTDRCGREITLIDAIPEYRFQEISAGEAAHYKEIWSRVMFSGRGELRYLNSNDIVLVGDIVAVQESFGFMKLCQISEIVYGKHAAGEIIAEDKTSLSNTGVLVTDKIFGRRNFSSFEILDEDGTLSDDWRHVFFVQRGRLTLPDVSGIDDPATLQLFDRVMKQFGF